MIGGLLLAFQMFSPTDPAQLRPLYEQAIAQRKLKFGETSAEFAAAMGDYGRFLARIADNSGATEWLERAVAVGGSLEDKQALALTLERTDQPRAEAVHEEVGRKAKGELAAVSWSRLGALQQARGGLPQAAKAYRAAIDTSTNGEKRAIRLNDLALLYKEQGNWKDAEPLFRQAVTLQQKLLGPTSPELGATLNNLSGLLLDARRPAEAEPLARRALDIFDGTLGHTHVRTGIAVSNLADVLMARGATAQAVKFYQRALAIFEKELGPEHPWTRDVRQAIVQ